MYIKKCDMKKRLYKSTQSNRRLSMVIWKKDRHQVLNKTTSKLTGNETVKYMKD